MSLALLADRCSALLARESLIGCYTQRLGMRGSSSSHGLRLIGRRH